MENPTQLLLGFDQIFIILIAICSKKSLSWSIFLQKSLEILYKEMQEELSRIRGTENRGIS